MTQDSIRIGLVSISDRASSGVYEDKGLPALEAWFGDMLANPAECAIVTDGVNGVVAADPADMAARLGRLLAEPEERVRLSAAAQSTARERYQPRRSADLLEEHYRALMAEPKMKTDFASLLGAGPADWFLSTQQRDGSGGPARMFASGGALSKGSIDHFLATFPDDPGLLALSGATPVG